MKTFNEFVTQRHQSGIGMLQSLDGIFQNIDNYDQAVDAFLTDLTRDHGPVAFAYKRYKDALTVLRTTIHTAMKHDRENPERGDHPPVSILQDPRD